MPTTPTLKNIPDEVYERLKTAAQAHRRSLNSEAIVCLETVLMPTKMTSPLAIDRPGPGTCGRDWAPSFMPTTSMR